MADPRESFPVIESDAQEGQVLSGRVEGNAAAAKLGLIGFSFKDASGNVVLPSLTSEGKVPVDFAGAGIPKSCQSAAPIAGSLTEVLVCEVALTAGKTYGKISARAACRKDAEFVLYQLDDVTSTVIASMILGPGQYSVEIDMGSKEFASGATGTQKLQLKAYNFEKAGDFRGSASCLEFV